MPSFDVVSQVDMQEVDNAINQARKEVDQRYDFKGSDDRDRAREGRRSASARRTSSRSRPSSRCCSRSSAKRQVPLKALRLRQDRAGGRRPRQADHHRAAGHRDREGAPDRQGDQGQPRSRCRRRSRPTRCASAARSATTCSARSSCSSSRTSTCRCSSSTSATDRRRVPLTPARVVGANGSPAVDDDGRAAGCGRRATRCSDPAAWVPPMVDRKDPACTGLEMNPEGRCAST